MDRGQRRFSKTMTSNVVDRQKRFENTTCGRGLFRKWREKTPFSKISGYVWTGKNDLKTLRVDTDFFENRRKKAPFSKISGYAVWTGPLFTFHQKKEAESLRDVLPSWSIL